MRSWAARVGVLALFAAFGLASWFYQPPLWLYPAAFALVFAFYANTALERVPLYLTNRTTWTAVAALFETRLETTRAPRIVDLGCGMGGVVAHLARAHPDWTVAGVETAPAPYLIAKLRTLGLPNATVRFQSLWRVDLSRFDGVYAFLSPAPMVRLLDKVARDMPPGGLFVSNSFWADGAAYDEVAEVGDSRASQLYIKRL